MDLDGDGNLDILSGSYSRMEKGMAGLFQVLYGNKDGSFRKAEVLNGTDGEPLIIPTKGDDAKKDVDVDQLIEKICTRPFAVDWDGDGKLDLVVGNFAGTFYLFRGQGKGKFAPTPELLMTGGNPLKLPGAHSDPFVIDWDGDGALDLLSGCHDGGVYWAKNRAGKGKVPDLAPFEPLIKPSPPVGDGQIVREEDVTGPTSASRIWVADINGDGKLDLLVGDSVRLVSPAKGVTEVEFKMKYADWRKDILQAAVLARRSNLDEKARSKVEEEYTAIVNRQRQFMREEMTGFVWLYLQK